MEETMTNTKLISLKKLTIYSTLMTAAMTATSLAEVQPCSPFKGFYAGGNVGYGVGRSKEKFQANIPTANASIYAKDRVSLEGVSGGINLGYTYVFPCTPVALGLEGVADWSNTKGSHNFQAGIGSPPIAGNFKASAHLKQTFQVLARFGYTLGRAMPYLKFGWDNSLWQYDGTISRTVPGQANARFLTFRKHKRLNGIAYGLGVDLAVYKCFIAGLEFTHVDFKRESASLLGGALKGSFRPHTNKVALTLKVMM